MEKLPLPQIRRAAASQGSQPNIAMTNYHSGPLPKICVQSTDIEIPRAVWSGWIPTGGEPRKLRRALTDRERAALETRRDELSGVVAGFAPHQENRVSLALADMYSAFPSMRHSDIEAEARIAAVRRVLREFPLWAIEKACGNIQLNGVWRNGKFDQQWPPSDAEIASEVRSAFRLYGDQYNSACALLAAEVEE